MPTTFGGGGTFGGGDLFGRQYILAKLSASGSATTSFKPRVNCRLVLSASAHATTALEPTRIVQSVHLTASGTTSDSLRPTRVFRFVSSTAGVASTALLNVYRQRCAHLAAHGSSTTALAKVFRTCSVDLGTIARMTDVFIFTQMALPPPVTYGLRTQSWAKLAFNVNLRTQSWQRPV